MITLLDKVKANLILEHDADDELLQRLIDAAVAQDARPELDLGLTPDSGSAAQEVG